MNKCWSIKKNKSHKKNNQNKEVVNQRASHHLLLLVLMLFIIFEPTLTSSSSSTFQQVQSSASTKTSVMSTKMESDNIKILFSDVDGTLVHYPEAIITTTEDNIDAENGNRILKLPPSATGMQGIISSNTLKTCQDIRKQGVKLVIVSGMRTSTLLKRLPYLPLADAYCSEAGGRIFYARSNHDPTINNIKNVPTYTATPKKYDGADPADLKPFTIVEDMEWRREMEQPHAAGTDGYVGAEINLLQDSSNSNVSHPIPVSERAGKLWEFAHKLTAKGFVLDTKGYSTCFRVNKKQQTSVSQEDFERLLRGECIVACPTELATSTNLGCIDYYPVARGKKKWYV